MTMYPSYPAQPPTPRRRRSDRYLEQEQSAQLQQPLQPSAPSSFQQSAEPQPMAYAPQPMEQQPMQGMYQQPMEYGQPAYYDYDQAGMMSPGAYQQPYQPPEQGGMYGQQDYGWAQPQQGYPQGNQPYAPQQGYGWENPQGYYAQPMQEQLPQQPIYNQNYYRPESYQGNPSNPFDNPGDDERRYHRGFQLSWLKWLLAPVAIALIVMAVRFGLQIRQRNQEEQLVRDYVTAYDDRFCEGVYVDGIHLGGMTQEEGINAVTAQAQQRNSEWSVRLTYSGQTVAEIDAASLGMKVDVLDVLRAAWQQGHQSGDIYERQAAMLQLQQEPYYGYTAMPSGDTTVVDTVLAHLSASAYKAPQDAQLIGFDPTRADPFTFQEAVPGRVLNTTALKERIYQMVSTMESGELEIVPEEIAPNITVADLRKTVSLIANVTTDVSTSSVENRNKNIERGCELLSGAVVQPGQTFSFNGRVGKRSIENGFHEAEEYVYGDSKTGVGGGICQVSTTLYMAAVAANMQITDHTPHSMKANYADYGTDATVYMDGKQIDFGFKNTSDYPIYIVASMPNKPKRSKEWMCQVKIYGMAFEEGVSYQLVAEEIETIPLPNPKYIKDTKGEYGLTYIDEEHVYSAGREGHITQSYRVKYLNGEEVSRTKLYRDTYNPAQPIIYTGTQKR